MLLHDVLGHELIAIGEMMSLTVAAAQSRLVRGRKELMARLAQERDGRWSEGQSRGERSHEQDGGSDG